MQVLTLFPDEPGAARKLGRVYFGLSHGQINLIKIGHTRRTNGHRGGELHFTELCHVDGDRLTEAHYHRKYATERIGRTEWFELSDQLLMDLITMCVSQHRVPSYEILKGILCDRLQQRRAA